MIATLLAAALMAQDGMLLAGPADALSMKKAAQEKHPAAVSIRKAADRALKEGPWSVTFHRPGPSVPVGPHDFYSDGPYWWPDPANPSGPYIRRDGQTNPNRFTANDRDQNEMCAAAAALGTAAYLYGDERYTKRLMHVLDVWFLDEKTRMAPHMENGQAVRNKDTGRNAGLIETRPYIWMLQGILLAEKAPGWDPRVGTGMRKWIAEYERWFTTSEKGKKEMKAGNNHSTWWAAQVAAFAIFTGNAADQRAMWTLYRESLVPGQFRPDGSAPREEERTRSLSYSAMNLDAFALLCRMAQVQGVDLWRYRASNGGAFEQAVRYLAPYVDGSKQWTKPQITKFDPRRTFFLALASLGLGAPELKAAQRRAGLGGGLDADIVALLLD